MTDEEAYLYDAETELRRARRTGCPDAALRARDFIQAYINERTDDDADEPYDGADALAYDVEAEAARIIEEKKERPKKPSTDDFWRDTAKGALNLD